jgi:hypothetical protein
MLTVYTICAVVGGVILVMQMLLTLLGADHDLGMAGDAVDHDIGHDLHDTGHFFGVLSFRSLVAALAFFGLGGRWALAEGWSPYFAFVAALAAATAAMFLVAWLMRLLASLVYEGTMRVENAVGQMGTVYLGIPGHNQGLGKVTVTVQSQSVEFDAVTSKDAIPTGATITVVGMAGPSTLEVEPYSVKEALL